jgi:nucleoside-diphosphate-sugar epimerase
MHIPFMTSSEIIERMQQLVPPGSDEPQNPDILAQLWALTEDLIRAYQASGRLQEDPFYEARTRPLYLYEAEVCSQLQGKVVLVTGGEGCVGSRLIQKLVELGVERIVSIDKARCADKACSQPIAGDQPGVFYYAADIRDYDTVETIFAIEQPQIVFHVAAQRHPGLAEKEIRETFTSNVFGTQNIIRLCEEFEVEQCIFSSTGKASRYFTAEVYAASKKMAEWMFAAALQRGRVRFGMVRFTHMLENSSMCEQIDNRVNHGKSVNIHAPDRYVAGQNVGEAVHLLLNALVHSESDRLKFVLVRHLGWPTESLEVALYKIIQSGKKLPIYFQGVIPGYEESFFLGQVDWDDQIDINTLINALETSYNSTISSSGDMIVGELVPFSTSVLNQQLAALKTLSHDPQVSEPQIKQGLATAVRAIARSSFLLTSPQKLLRVLRWGVNPKHFERGELKLAAHQDIIELLVNSLVDRLTLDVLHSTNVSVEEFEELLAVLAHLPAIRSTVAMMQARIATATDNLESSADLVAASV